MKRNNYFILFALLFTFFMSNLRAQHINAGEDFSVCQGETEINLHADVGQVLTGRYSVSQIPFNWDSDFSNAEDVILTDGGVASPLRIDDRYSDPISLPFPIYFYGEIYNEIVVGSNGDIIFEPSVSGTYDSWSIDPTELIPNHTLPYWDGTSLSYASIMGAYHDIDISVTPLPATAALKYKTIGTAPNRKFIIIYNDIPQYSSSCNSLLTSQEIVFNENDLSIEVHIKNKPVCSTWNDGLATLGIQNEELLPDTCGNYPGDVTSPTLPNRNTGAWEVLDPNNEAYKFTPDANVTVKWYDANRNVVGTGADVTIPFNDTMTYTLEVTYEDCHENVFAEFDEITVTRLPDLDVQLPENDIICQDETKILDGTVQNASDYNNINYTWTDDNGNVLSTDPKLSITTPGIYTITIDADGCIASFTDNVTPYPYKCQIPQGISPNGDNLNDNWVLDYLAQEKGIENLQIFDRRGVLVYEKQDYTHEFEGKNKNGNELPAAAYFYVIKLKDGEKLTGWLYLAR
jgi:gliding motility-associated-like protein